jgi:CheY-like chemotaxis protein
LANIAGDRADSGRVAKILVVEDDADVSNLLVRRLQSYGHTVRSAPSGRFAMTTVGIDFPIDLAIIDINLPGMNGFATLEELRRHPELDNPNLPAVFLSAEVSPENYERSAAVGAQFLVKPFVSGELQGAILHTLGLHSNPTPDLAV